RSGGARDRACGRVVRRHRDLRARVRARLERRRGRCRWDRRNRSRPRRPQCAATRQGRAGRVSRLRPLPRRDCGAWIGRHAAGAAAAGAARRSARGLSGGRRGAFARPHRRAYMFRHARHARAQDHLDGRPRGGRAGAARRRRCRAARLRSLADGGARAREWAGPGAAGERRLRGRRAPRDAGVPMNDASRTRPQLALLDAVRAAARQEQFLEVVAAEEAKSRFARHLDLAPLAAESVALADALGRVLAHDVAAPIDVPPFDRANVDGFALRAADTTGASDATPRRLTLNAEVLACGHAPKLTVAPGTATAIATGGMIPRGADAVVMIENTELIDAVAPAIDLRRAVSAGHFVS